MVVAGDFNQWRIDNALANFADIKEVPVGCTRGSRAIDRIFLNMKRSVKEYGTLDPLENCDSTKKSDHLVCYCRVELQRKEVYRWEAYSYRRYTDESVSKFRDWIVWFDWREVLEAADSDTKAEVYQRIVTDAVDEFFPLRKVKKKSTDPPWMDKRTLKMIEDRRRLFIEEGGLSLIHI